MRNSFVRARSLGVGHLYLRNLNLRKQLQWRSGARDAASQPDTKLRDVSGKPKRRRLDEVCFESFPEHDRKAIQSWILQGKVLVGGTVNAKAGCLVSAKDVVSLNVLVPRYVNRAGQKLEAALSYFGINATGKSALDAGICTGGFTDCLLQHGARSVIGVDTGYGKVSEKLRADSRLVLMERTNLRHLALSDLPGGNPVDIVTLDLSFISLLTVIPAVSKLLRPAGELVALVKPQFEAARHQVEAGGIVSDDAVHQEVLAKVTNGIEATGFESLGTCESPVRGAVGGNKEFLAYFKRL